MTYILDSINFNLSLEKNCDWPYYSNIEQIFITPQQNSYIKNIVVPLNWNEHDKAMSKKRPENGKWVKWQKKWHKFQSWKSCPIIASTHFSKSLLSKYKYGAETDWAWDDEVALKIVLCVSCLLCILRAHLTYIPHEKPIKYHDSNIYNSN